MFDLAITGGTVIDPADKRLIPANVYVIEGKIAEISRMTHEAKECIDASGMYVSPGFIDMHTHTDNNMMVGEMLVRQGVTTVTGGHCGLGPTDLPAFFKEAEKGFIVNQSQFAGAWELRERVGLTDPTQPMNEEQIVSAEKALLADLETGAAGLSFGLEYMTGSSFEEIIRLSKIVAYYGKPVMIHTRGGFWSGLESLKEAINISRQTGAAVNISHLAYMYGHGMMSSALEIIDSARREGVDISCDCGMYTSFSTLIGTEAFNEDYVKTWGCDLDKIFVASGKYAGQQITSSEMFQEVRKNSPDAAANAMIGCPNEILLAFDLPYMMCSSDAGVSTVANINEAVHPQDAATFAKFLREAVVMTRRLTLVDAVSRITTLPAERMGFSGKGRIIPGADADIVVFDIERVQERADFPHLGQADAPPEGFYAVIIDGKIVVDNGEIRCSNAGKVLRSANVEWKLQKKQHHLCDFITLE